jgi:CD109 antigen
VAPNVAVLRYAASSPAAQQPAALLAAARDHAALGWQRELTYRHADGSYSAFGTSDPGGSTWLTAFVLRVFSQALPFVTLDDAAVRSAAAWLAAQQVADGSFRSVGNVVHSEMVGGMAGNVALTSFVLASLLEAPPADVPAAALHSAVVFLAAARPASNETYARVLRSHALATACAAPSAPPGACAASDAALDDVMADLSDAAKGQPHWSAGGGSTGNRGAAARWQAPAADIELTGYGTLALLARGRVADAAGPARWLTSHRGGGGGFASTQDTCVALAALGAFAAATAAAPPRLTLTVHGAAGGAPLAKLRLDADSAGTMQRLELPSGGGDITVAAEGEGVALLQLTTRYSQLPAPAASAFLLVTQAFNVTAAGGARPTLHHRTCFTRSSAAAAVVGGGDGMLLLQVGLFSGYAPLENSLEAAAASAPRLVRRVENGGRSVAFYLEPAELAASGGGLCLGKQHAPLQRFHANALQIRLCQQRGVGSGHHAQLRHELGSVLRQRKAGEKRGDVGGHRRGAEERLHRFT